ncbi:peptidyl-tRNA hydrolase [Desulfurococcaceae archaeon AG1]|jgi:PTH2 family peptidyl-tRNA hydrolase|nr:MAG: aminoacyl-tRNA hydrolase [Desulfurococcaceae archaeon]GAY25310.1 peptidyl-tRNA hydrolase [Desulfurococcaceae archaeon AG1]
MRLDEFKQVIVVRTDLRMSPGKLAVQVAHASVDAALRSLRNERWRRWLDEWISQGMKKVVVKGGSEEDLLKIYDECVRRELPCSMVRDAGRTELEPGTLTAVCVGPAPSNIVDEITGKLQLY